MKWSRVAVVSVLLGAAFAGYIVGCDSEVLKGPPCSATAVGGTFEFDDEQAAHATTIAAVAKKRGLPDRAVSIALATALQESNLYNIGYGDLDSVGLFQQRPSQGWGTVEEIMSPSVSAGKFFDGLVKVEGWQAMRITDAAQAVQRSAYPEAYDQWDRQSRVMAQAFVGQVGAGFRCRYDEIGPTVSTRAMTLAMDTELGLRPGRDVTEDQGWLLCAWLIGHAQEWGTRSVSFLGQRWTSESGEWSAIAESERIVRVGT